MMRSRVFIFLAVTICFVACLCAQATGSEAEAIKAVHDAEQSIVKVIKMAERELKEANDVNNDMNWYEEKAEKRVSEAAEAETAAVAAADKALKAANNNKDAPAVQAARQKRNEAQSFATNQKNKLKNARAAYPNVKTDTNTAIQSLTNVSLKVRTLDEKEEIEVLPDTESTIDYNKVMESALRIKNQAEALVKEIENATKLLSGAKSIIYRMPAPTKGELIEKHKADGIVAGAALDTIVGEAKSIVENIEYRKSEVNQSVERIKNIFKNNPEKLSTHINRFLNTAQGDLVAILERVNEAHEAQQKIMNWKQHAENSKAKLKGAKDDTTSKTDLRHIKFYSERSAMELERMEEILMSAGQSARSAHNQLQSAADEILKNNGTLKSKITASTQKPKPIVEDTEIIPPKKEDEQKTQQKTEEPAKKVTEISTDQKAEQRTDQQTEKNVEETTTKPTNKDAVQLIDQQKQEPAEEETTTTNKTPKVPAENKPDQLTEEQTTKQTTNTAEGQTANQPKQSAERDTELPQKDATVKSTMINHAKEINETSQTSAHQASDQREMEQTVQPKEKKSQVLEFDKLRKSKKNITKVPFFGENLPASGDWSDGSMIVCVPLVAALIASVVLH